MLETLLNKGDTAERCGFVLNDGSVVEVKNIAPDRTLGYEMDPVEVLEYLDDAKETWHTHPDTDPNLSGEDRLGFLSWPDMKHNIIGLRNGKVVVLQYEIEDGFVMSCD